MPPSDVGIGQSQDDSIVGMKQSKQIHPTLPVSGNLSSSNPDLLQSHHRILDFSNSPGEGELVTPTAVRERLHSCFSVTKYLPHVSWWCFSIQTLNDMLWPKE